MNQRDQHPAEEAVVSPPEELIAMMEELVFPFTLDHTPIHLVLRPGPDSTPIPLPAPYAFWKMEVKNLEKESEVHEICDRVFDRFKREVVFQKHEAIRTRLLNDAIRRGLPGRILDLAKTLAEASIDHDSVFAIASIVAAGINENKLAQFFHSRIKISDPISDLAYRIADKKYRSVSDRMLEMNHALALFQFSSRGEDQRFKNELSKIYREAYRDSDLIYVALSSLLAAGQLFRMVRLVNHYKNEKPELEYVLGDVVYSSGGIVSYLKWLGKQRWFLSEEDHVRGMLLIATVLPKKDQKSLKKAALSRLEQTLRLHAKGAILTKKELQTLAPLILGREQDAPDDQSKNDFFDLLESKREWIVSGLNREQQNNHPGRDLFFLEDFPYEYRLLLIRRLASRFVDVIEQQWSEDLVYRLKLFSGMMPSLSSLLGMYYGIRNQDQTALRFLDRGGINQPFALHILALALFQKNQKGRAIRIYRRLTRRFPEQASLWNNFGILLEKYGQMEQSKDAFRKRDELEKRLHSKD